MQGVSILSLSFAAAEVERPQFQFASFANDLPAAFEVVVHLRLFWLCPFENALTNESAEVAHRNHMPEAYCTKRLPTSLARCSGITKQFLLKKKQVTPPTCGSKRQMAKPFAPCAIVAIGACKLLCLQLWRSSEFPKNFRQTVLRTSKRMSHHRSTRTLLRILWTMSKIRIRVLLSVMQFAKSSVIHFTVSHTCFSSQASSICFSTFCEMLAAVFSDSSLHFVFARKTKTFSVRTLCTCCN